MIEGSVPTPEMELVDLRLLTRNARLLQARVENGLTQNDLSLLTGIPLKRIKQIENLWLIPNLEVMEEISSALEKPVEFLFPPELLAAIEEGVFHERRAQLGTRQIISITEAKRLGFQPALSLTSGSEEVEKKVQLDELRNQIKGALGALKSREQKVLAFRFNLDGEGEKTREEIGLEFGVTRERIRQIEEGALKKLRHSTRKLKNFL